MYFLSYIYDHDINQMSRNLKENPMTKEALANMKNDINDLNLEDIEEKLRVLKELEYPKSKNK